MNWLNWFGYSGGTRHGHGGQVRSVPEIDASTGLLALAAAIAILALAWELRRRRG